MRVLASSTLALLLGASACGHDAPATPGTGTTRLDSVLPADGAVAVDPDEPITLVFTHPMVQAVEPYAALHEGPVSGPVVDGAWTWSEDATRLTFTPSHPFARGAMYTLHLGGGMVDAQGHVIDMVAYHQEHHAGQWVTGAMMGAGGMMDGGGMMHGDGAMMGPGWQHANGSYGMIFTFQTAF